MVPQGLRVVPVILPPSLPSVLFLRPTSGFLHSDTARQRQTVPSRRGGTWRVALVNPDTRHSSDRKLSREVRTNLTPGCEETSGLGWQVGRSLSDFPVPDSCCLLPYLLLQLWALPPFGPDTRTGLAGFATPVSNRRLWLGQARPEEAALPLTPRPKSQPPLSYLLHLGWVLPQPGPCG